MTRVEAALHFTKLKEADELIREEYRRLGRVEEAAACAQDIEACEAAIEALAKMEAIQTVVDLPMLWLQDERRRYGKVVDIVRGVENDKKRSDKDT